jgi:hypothetical protein
VVEEQAKQLHGWQGVWRPAGEEIRQPGSRDRALVFIRERWDRTGGPSHRQWRLRRPREFGFAATATGPAFLPFPNTVGLPAMIAIYSCITNPESSPSRN